MRSLKGCWKLAEIEGEKVMLTLSTVVDVARLANKNP